MAEAGANEADASVSRAADQFYPQNDEATQEAGAPISRASPAMTGFQAINANVQAVTQNSNAAASTANSPQGDVAVAHEASQTTLPDDSAAPKTSAQDDDLDNAMASDAATYGTRSRNRTNIRPNYAEDQEEFDFTSAATTTKKKPAGTDPVSAAAQTTAEAKRAHDFSRLISDGAATNGAGTKESTPGTPGVSTNPTKKRKAAGAPAASTQTPPASSTPAPVVATTTRKLAAPSTVARETNVLTFTKHKSCLNKKGELVADDGTKLCVNDHVYLVCEPPGDPYYLCRIMEFLHVRSDDQSSPIDSLRVNWYYRPRDVQRFNSDSRLVYGTMHSDLCPITSLRGRCTIKHRSEIEDLDAYRKERDSFYFVQIFDRFIHRWYECIPVSQIVNVPEKVKKALDERWKFVVVEIGRVKELTSAVKTCKRCAKYCATQDSVDCAICKNSYHMNCVQPPLPKKPSRGFAWACGPCSRASEKKLEQRDTPTISGEVTEAEEEELLEEEVPSASNDTTRAPSPSASDRLAEAAPATQAEVALAKMWPMRYLGIHSRVEDALQYDDRAIYPRASSRLGPRHQANVTLWPGRPVELVKPADIKKRYNKNNSHKKDGKLTKETLAALEADREERARRPKWVQDEPPGYIARGEDFDANDPRNTAKLMFKAPTEDWQVEKNKTETYTDPTAENAVDNFLKRAKLHARTIGVPPFGVNFLDKALELWTTSDYNQDGALRQLQKMHRVRDLHEPVLSKPDLIKFEEGVAKYGSEHRLVRLHMKTDLPNSDIVRFYYLWKKTPKGKEIWGSYGGRKGSKRKVDNDAGAQLQQAVANDGDDSAFDADKAARRSRGFQCKFCNTVHSRQWRKAPGVAPGQTVSIEAKNGKDKSKPPLLALCIRCAGLWRKYAIQWEDIDEVAKKVAQGGGRAWKRRIDEELLRELVAANEAASIPGNDPAMAAVPSIEMNGEPPKKKSKTDAPLPLDLLKKKEKPPPPPKEPTPPPPPIVPTQPQWKALPCAVCHTVEGTIECDHCKLTVHRQCFGLSENDGVRANGEVRWVCEQCANDRNPQISTDYACCLCLTEETLIDLVEPPKISHKKKTDREREKERMEKELADGMRAEYHAKQVAYNYPTLPREPLKRTTGNNWVHVYCAVFTPEIRFSNAKQLQVAEGFQLIPPARHEAVCKLCKNKDHSNKFRDDKGACVPCFQCHQNVHVSCAFEAGYLFGFDVTPVKGSRKDQITTATLGEESGLLTAGIWCKEHVVKTPVHPINEIIDDSGKTALQVYVEHYKQADLNLTGTVRKATLAQLTRDKAQQAAQPATNGARRESTANSIAAAVRRGARTSSATDARSENEDGAAELSELPEAPSVRRCVKCQIDVTPKWHLITESTDAGKSKSMGEIADQERDRAGGIDINGRSQQGQNPQNIRFMPPGASGRAWDGMPERFATRPMINGEANTSAAGFGGQHEPSREVSGTDTNGDYRTSTEPYHNHALPPHQNSASNTTLADPEVVEAAPEEYLCHKCFLKKKLDPTPPPQERPPVRYSPPGQFPPPMGWNQPPSQPQYDHSQPHRMPWDDPPPPQNQPPPAPPPPPPPPHMNGLGVSFNQYHHPQPPPNYPVYGQHQPNGYHVPHPSHPGPPPRHDSYQYGAPQPTPPNPQAYPPPPRQSPYQGYPPPPPPLVQPMSNGVTSPRASHHAPLQSPTHPPPPPFSGYGQPHSGSPYSSQLPPYGQPRFNSPQRPAEAPPAPLQPPTPQAQYQLSSGTQTSQNDGRPTSQAGRPATPPVPQTGQTNATPAAASASPNVRNLLS